MRLPWPKPAKRNNFITLQLQNIAMVLEYNGTLGKKLVLTTIAGGSNIPLGPGKSVRQEISGKKVNDPNYRCPAPGKGRTSYGPSPDASDSHLESAPGAIATIYYPLASRGFNPLTAHLLSICGKFAGPFPSPSLAVPAGPCRPHLYRHSGGFYRHSGERTSPPP